MLYGTALDLGYNMASDMEEEVNSTFIEHADDSELGGPAKASEDREKIAMDGWG